ncbi:hypothetical protein [Gordonia polyisoprenivorans]|uniref:hypothetical protein n=1 Tax=Gordonia polyisoprenivorans TaxID=84595 RepID=UPI001AD6C637|nr:hypothetical protein [Gordonia polyisoprenivorans]QTI70548.1 hypothetical protein J6U32_08365 [Gordonia polyisoprenivorans]
MKYGIRILEALAGRSFPGFGVICGAVSGPPVHGRDDPRAGLDPVGLAALLLCLIREREDKGFARLSANQYLAVVEHFSDRLEIRVGGKLCVGSCAGSLRHDLGSDAVHLSFAEPPGASRAAVAAYQFQLRAYVARGVCGAESEHKGGSGLLEIVRVGIPVVSAVSSRHLFDEVGVWLAEGLTPVVVLASTLGKVTVSSCRPRTWALHLRPYSSTSGLALLMTIASIRNPCRGGA